MAASGHFGCSKITFDCISSHFRSIDHFECLKLLLIEILVISDRYRILLVFFAAIFGHFRSIRILIIFFNFGKMAAGGHFGLDDNVSYRTRPRYLDEQCMCQV